MNIKRCRYYPMLQSPYYAHYSQSIWCEFYFLWWTDRSMSTAYIAQCSSLHLKTMSAVYTFTMKFNFERWNNTHAHDHALSNKNTRKWKLEKFDTFQAIIWRVSYNFYWNFFEFHFKISSEILVKISIWFLHRFVPYWFLDP